MNIYVYRYVYIYIYEYTCIYICIYICVYVCICMYLTCKAVEDAAGLLGVHQVQVQRPRGLEPGRGYRV